MGERQEPSFKEGQDPNRHAIAQYALLEQPRPGNRETRMREVGGGWLQRNDQPEGTT